MAETFRVRIQNKLPPGWVFLKRILPKSSSALYRVLCWFQGGYFVFLSKFLFLILS